jgi:hypothetical protein
MAQSALTVTPPNPTPPTNQSCTGATPPNPPNYTKNTYIDWAPDTDFDTNPPPYFDDGASGSLVALAANTAALASGSGATAGGTEGSYPGAGGVTPPNPHFMGAVPASTSVAHEAAGTEVVFTGTVPNPSPNGQIQAVSVLGAYTATPNASHASYLSAGTAPVITGLSAGGVSGIGTTALTVTGTGFTRAAEVYVDGIKQNTNYVSATSLTVAGAPKKLTAGTRAVTVLNGVGGTPSNSFNWTFT